MLVGFSSQIWSGLVHMPVVIARPSEKNDYQISCETPNCDYQDMKPRSRGTSWGTCRRVLRLTKSGDRRSASLSAREPFTTTSSNTILFEAWRYDSLKMVLIESERAPTIEKGPSWVLSILQNPLDHHRVV